MFGWDIAKWEMDAAKTLGGDTTGAPDQEEGSHEFDAATEHDKNTRLGRKHMCTLESAQNISSNM